MIRALKLCRWALPLLGMACFFPSAHALDPNRMISQYVHEKWNADRGIRGHVLSITQTPDGYLWIGTDNGLVRFDGFSFQAVSLLPVGLASNSPVLGLITDADGNLVVRLAGTVVLLKNNTKFASLGSEVGLSASYVTAIWKEENGGVLFSDLVSGTVRFRGKRVEVLARPSRLPGAPLVTSLAETPDGKIWMGTLGTGLFYVSQGQVTKVSAALPERKVNCMLSVNQNELWVGTDSGLFRWNGKGLSRGALPARFDKLQVLTLLKDRASNVWVGTPRGLLRINAKGVSFADESAPGTEGAVNTLFEDREGNLWVGGTSGLERIRDSAFVTYSKTTGLPSESNGPVYADAADRIWSASTDGGLYWLEGSRVEKISKASRVNDEVYSIAGRNGDIWIGLQHGGLTHLYYSGAVMSSETYTERNGLAQNSVYSVHQSRDGTVWAGTLSGGVSRLKDGRFTTYTAGSGLASNTINAILETRDGTMWFATPNGLSSLFNGQWKTLTASDGLPSTTVNCLVEDSEGILWAGTSEGLAFFSASRVQVPGNVPELLHGQVFGIAEDKNGWFWIATANHVMAVRRDKLMVGALGSSDLREYGSEDGLLSNDGVKRNNSVISDPLGRIWFSLSRGLSVADPSHVADNSAPAITHVEGVFADGSRLDDRDLAGVPASRKRITFAYTGLSLAAPERIRFRYFLEGFDRTWSDPVASREAVYTNLNAGWYRFHLVACNSDGVWNGAETDIRFEIKPVFWKTWWFGLSCVIVILVLLWTFHQLRLRQLQHQFNVGLEARVNERTRIARELHDTLLQGFQGMMFRLQAVRDMLPGHAPAEAIEALDSALESGDKAIAEGRDTVSDLRGSAVGDQDVADALTALGQELAAQGDNGAAPCVRVLVEGKQRELDPLLRDEVYRIAREALRNAFRHAKAQAIETEIMYGESEFLLYIRDDGSGIDSKVANQGARAGHWGLPGMRERAKSFGGKLEVWSEHGAGTEVELIVPASIAYGKSEGRRRFWFWRKKAEGAHGRQS